MKTVVVFLLIFCYNKTIVNGYMYIKYNIEHFVKEKKSEKIQKYN